MNARQQSSLSFAHRKLLFISGTRGTGGKIEAEQMVIPTEYLKVS